VFHKSPGLNKDFLHQRRIPSLACTLEILKCLQINELLCTYSPRVNKDFLYQLRVASLACSLPIINCLQKNELHIYTILLVQTNMSICDKIGRQNQQLIISPIEAKLNLYFSPNEAAPTYTFRLPDTVRTYSSGYKQVIFQKSTVSKHIFYT
jgi:hypothetical protein